MKRKLCTEDDDSRPRKRHAPDVIVVSDGEEESLEDILLKIKQQEESEALARQLAEHWSGSSMPQASSSNHQHLLLDDDEMEAYEGIEGDEAMARRLADLWAAEDQAQAQLPLPAVPVASNTSSGSSAGPSRSYGASSAGGLTSDGTADEKLNVYRDLFVRTRKCTKCHEDVPSPRGYVRHPVHSQYRNIIITSINPRSRIRQLPCPPACCIYSTLHVRRARPFIVADASQCFHVQ